MTENLFFLGPDNAPRVMMPSGFLSEDEFQTLLERYPELLTDSDFGEGSPRRWMLIKREAGIGDREDGGGRWSVDHLFLDQAGVPTLVEVKRATDTRARREVVAQMLDYAANSVSWWTIEDIRNWFIETSTKRGEDGGARLSALLDTNEVDEEGFWRQVESNLRSGRIRMLFVADQIAPELQRIVEFLNEQMKSATVAALELRLFSDGAGKILAPRIFGATQRAALTKGAPRSFRADGAYEWLEATDPEPRERLKKSFDLAKALGFRLTVASQSIALDIKAQHTRKNYDWVRSFYLKRTGYISFAFYMLQYGVNFHSPESRLELAEKLQEMGFTFSSALSNVVSGEPTFPLPKVTDQPGWDRIEQAMRLVRDCLSQAK